MSSDIKCLNCNGTNIHTGALHSTGKTHFRPSDVKFLKMETANIDVNANMCLDCGYISLTGDIEKAKKLTDGGGG